MRVIKIDVAKKLVHEINVKNELKSIYAAIGDECIGFECPVSFDNGDALYCDEEGLYHNITGGFTFPGFQYPIVGNALIIGTDAEGGSIEPYTAISQIERKIKWVSKEDAQAWAERVMG